MDYIRDEHRVHLVVYHIVWTPRRRRPLLIGEVAEECHASLLRKCAERGWIVLNLTVQPDHVHLFVRVYPQTAIDTIVKECKGYSSRVIREKYPEIRSKLPSLWTRSYFAATAGNVSQETIQKYIDAQKGLH